MKWSPWGQNACKAINLQFCSSCDLGLSLPVDGAWTPKQLIGPMRTYSVQNLIKNKSGPIKHYNWTMDGKRGDENLILLKSMGFGIMTGLISLPLEHPFDAIKTNMQSQQTRLVETARSIYARKGYRGFYNGFSMNLLRVVVKQAYRWPLWISMSTLVRNLMPHSNEVLRQTTTGFAISLTEILLISPLQRIKVWLMTTKAQQESKLFNYFRLKGGIRDLFRGFFSLLLRQGLSWSSFLTATQVFKNLMKSYRNSQHLTSLDLFLVSLPVSFINTLFIMPADCIKTMYQNHSSTIQGERFLGAIGSIYLKCGLRGLYLGWSARIMQYTIQSTLTLTLIEDLQRQYRSAYNKN